MTCCTGKVVVQELQLVQTVMNSHCDNGQRNQNFIKDVWQLRLSSFEAVAAQAGSITNGQKAETLSACSRWSMSGM